MTQSGVAGTWTYTDNNELLTVADIEYDYDDNGNLIQKRVGTAAVNYSYDVADRLIKVEDDLTQTVIAEYGYDPFGRRLWKEVNGERTYFLYAQEGLVAEYDASGAELRSYGYQPSSKWSTNPLFLRTSGQYSYYVHDRGTPVKLIAGNGAVAWAADYTVFGEAAVHVQTIDNPLRLPGQYYDAETGLHYNYNRYYDPATGRYLQEDPLGFGGGDPNLYAYTWSDPVNWIDPKGTFLDTIFDVATLFMGIHTFLTDENPCNFWINLAGVGLDLVDILVPVVTGLGEMYKAGKYGDDLYDTYKAMDKMEDAYDVYKTGNKATDVIKSGACFAADTLIHTAEGPRPIEEVKTNEFVWARDEETGDVALRRIVRVFVTPDQAVLELAFQAQDGSTENIQVTGDHPFWVKDKGWVEAAKLLPGDEVFTSTGGWVRISNGTWLSQRQTVYNFEVEGFHTYFVGEIGLWVHNMCAQRSIHSKYADGVPVYEAAQPPRLGAPTPDPQAVGAHSRLRWDPNNNRTYQAREFDTRGCPVRDIDFTSPTYPNGNVRPDHLPPPHQHQWIPNDPRNFKAGFKRSKKPTSFKN